MSLTSFIREDDNGYDNDDMGIGRCLEVGARFGVHMHIHYKCVLKGKSISSLLSLCLYLSLFLSLSLVLSVSLSLALSLSLASSRLSSLYRA